MNTLRIDRDADGVVTLRLDSNPEKPRGGVVVLDSWLIEQLRRSLEAILAAEPPSGFILESASDRVFVAGADLAEIDALDDRQLHEYLRAGSRAFALIRSLPCPSAAIVHKAALGGGLEVAMHCDAIVGVMPAAGEKPWRLGLVEAGVGLCPGWGGTQMLPARIDPAIAIRATASGETWEAPNAPRGLFESTAPSRDAARTTVLEWIAAQRTRPRRTMPVIDRSNAALVGAALAAVRSSLPATESAAAVAECVDAGVRSGWDAALERERANLVRLRHTPAAREKLAAFLKR
ncbi:MAG: enoyl-CoA hydratase/isomerase family protein [Phycisphaerae bacterium]|nr:enoyl-CoA hydratase/isomerase family protein [Phycisphaerae bacterium]